MCIHIINHWRNKCDLDNQEHVNPHSKSCGNKKAPSFKAKGMVQMHLNNDILQNIGHLNLDTSQNIGRIKVIVTYTPK